MLRLLSTQREKQEEKDYPEKRKKQGDRKRKNEECGEEQADEGAVERENGERGETC